MKTQSLFFTRIFFLVFCLVLASPTLQASSRYFGINIGGIVDFGDDRTFADAFRTGRDFKRNADNLPAALDARGWPTEDCTITVLSLPNSNGKYKLTFTGGVNTVVTLPAGGSISNRAISGNNISYDVVLSSGNGQTNLYITFSNTGGGVRDVKLMRPITKDSLVPYASNVEFTDQILNLVNNFQCVRFLGWSAINGSIDKEWSDRVADDHHWGSYPTAGYGWEGRGGSWESMIRFCNTSNKDAWITIPIKASDDYVIQLAKLFKANLNPNLKLYVEYSNEIWNSAQAFFTQFEYNFKTAFAEVQAGNSPLNYDNLPVTGNPNGEDWTFVQRRPGKRIAEISLLFRSVYGNADMMTKVRPVLAWQQPVGANSGWALDYIDKVYGTVNKWNAVAHPVNYYLYGGGGSAYYNPHNESDLLTIDNIWTSAEFDINSWKNSCKSEIDLCAAYGITRVAYEGGPSMDNVGHSEAVKAQAWGDVRMTDIVTGHQTLWEQYGGGLLNYLCSTGDYQWAFTQDIFNLNTPKMDAVAILNSTPADAVTYGYTIPSTINAELYSTAGGGNVAITTNNLGLRSNANSKSWASYTINCTNPGTYNVSFKVNNSNYTGTIELYFDGLPFAALPITVAGQTSPTYTLANMKAGIHSVRLLNTSTSEIGLTSITFTAGAGALPGIDLTDVTPPTAPTALVASNVISVGATISWTAATDNVVVAGYDVYNGATLLGSTATNSIQIKGLTPSTLYNITVKAVDASSNVSAASTAVSFTTSVPDVTVPSTPAALVASNIAETSMTLNWNASTDNIGVVGYQVYKGGVLIASPTATTYSVAGLAPSTSYNFTVKAVDAVPNLSAASTALVVSTIADLVPPTVPGPLISSSITETSVQLNWTNSTDNVALVGYDLYKDGSLIASPTTNSYAVTGLTLGVSYSFTVRAKDAHPNYSALTVPLVVKTAVPDLSAPSVPSTLVAGTITATSVVLNWGASTDNVGVAGYDVYQGGILLASSLTNSYTVTGLASATSYNYQVRSRDASGNASALSNTVTVVTNPPGIAIWDLTNVNATSNVTTAAVSTKDANLTVSNLTLHPAMGSNSNYSSSLLSGMSVDLGNSLAQSISNNYYGEFTITPAAGKSVSITNISACFITGGRVGTISLLSSLNGFSASTVISSVTSGPANEVHASLQDLPVTGHDNLTTPVTFRFYFTPSAQWDFQYKNIGIGFRHPSQAADVIVSGSVQSIVVAGLSESDRNVAVSLFPNPANDKLNLNFGTQVENARISILDLQGRSVLYKLIANKQLETLDISSLSNGIYLVKVNANGKVMNSRFVKK